MPRHNQFNLTENNFIFIGMKKLNNIWDVLVDDAKIMHERYFNPVSVKRIGTIISKDIIIKQLTKELFDRYTIEEVLYINGGVIKEWN